MIRIEEVTLRLDEGEDSLPAKISEILGVDEKAIVGWKISKKALDSRRKRKILFVYSVDVELADGQKYLENIGKLPTDIVAKVTHHKVRWVEPFVYGIKKASADKIRMRPIVVGTGPCGLFAALALAMAGLRPIVIERGKDVSARVEDVSRFASGGKFDPKSNIQFGEGGAGTFSDGKLYTLINDPRKKFIFDELIEAGAPAEIAYDAHPHVGTDKLRLVVRNLRNKIIELGGEVRFETCLTGIVVDDGKIESVIVNDDERLPASDVVLAIGHSARDTYQMLYDQKMEIVQKPFSVGVRVEHQAQMINKAQYGDLFDNPKLPTARYKMAVSFHGLRPVYTFCMCPGGYVMAAASEEGMVVTNGMSEYAQDGENSNSALLVNVFPADFQSDHPLAGVEFQRDLEKKAFIAGGENYHAPAQLVGDFLENKPSTRAKAVNPTYRPGVTFTDLSRILPMYVVDSLRAAIPALNQKIRGFSHRDAVLTGVETRTSAPVRLVRDETMQSNIRGIFPAGEGAGYAGGIVSSAVDGLKVAEMVIERYV